MKIQLKSRSKAIGFFAIIIATLVVTFLAAEKGNEFWESPLIALAIMWLIGNFPAQNPKDLFEWVYLLLVIGSGCVLMFTPEQVYWTSPILVGVVINILGGEMVIKIGDQ